MTPATTGVMESLSCYLDWECVPCQSVKAKIMMNCCRCVPSWSWQERIPTGLTRPTHAFRGLATITLQIPTGMRFCGKTIGWCLRIPCGYSHRNRTATWCDIRGSFQTKMLFGVPPHGREETTTWYAYVHNIVCVSVYMCIHMYIMCV